MIVKEYSQVAFNKEKEKVQVPIKCKTPFKPTQR